MQNRFINSLSQLPTRLAKVVDPLLNASFSGHIRAKQLADLAHASQMAEAELLMALLPIASALSSAPMSQFYVGAIAKGGSGDIYMGANLELPGEALFHSVHAEQSAISHAWLSGEQQITDIIVTASPCGHCRQFINELINGQQVKIHLPSQPSQPLSHYLPSSFGPSDLNIHTPLLSQQHTALTSDNNDPLMIEGIQQASLSYAPYTSHVAAVVLATHDGATYCGRYAENAAFNPSMLPMQMALSTLIRHGRQFNEISRAILIESTQGKISLVNATINALQAVATIELEHVIVTPAPSPC